MKATRTLFGQRLRQVRLERGLTQKKVGVAAGLDPKVASARMAQYERGTHTPPFETAERLARALRVPAAFFYAGDDTLAQVIVGIGKLRTRERKRVLEVIETMQT